MVKSINGADTIPDLLSSHTAQLADIVTDVESFPKQGSETDDTGRIKRALSSLASKGGGRLLLPKASYTISDEILIDQTYPYIEIEGAFGTGTVIKQTVTNKNGIHVQGVQGSSYVKNFRLKNIQLQGTNDGSGVGLILSSLDVQSLSLENILVLQFGGDGIQLTDTIGADFKKVRTLYNKGIGLKITTSSGGTNQCKFDNLYSYGNNQGLWVEGIGHTFIGGQVESNTNEGIVMNGAEITTFIGTDIESNGADSSVRLIGGGFSKGNTFLNCTLGNFTGRYGIHAELNSTQELTIIGGRYATNATAITGAVAIQIESGNPQLTLITPNFQNYATGVNPVYIDSNSQANATVIDTNNKSIQLGSNFVQDTAACTSSTRPTNYPTGKSILDVTISKVIVYWGNGTWKDTMGNAV